MDTASPRQCPDCGTDAASALAGRCPRCRATAAPTVEDPGPGCVLADRYEIRELVGRGGMAEVYRAFDLKLRVEVALKAVRPTRRGDARAREALRHEVRAARAIASPNVCRIFDLVDEGGAELLSMEYVDGETLAQTLWARGPLEPREAREIAAQLLSGLEAIHRAGLVHGDLKPENVMITRAGRVVVMDLGVARATQDARAKTVSGTPAYMSPEQARGNGVDARADVYAAGVVLAEMLSLGGAGWTSARQALWLAVRETPPRVPEGPWAPVLRRALDARLEERYASARALARALEEVTLRLPGVEAKRPYPGLASFTEEQAEYFFGRELETEAVWKKLERPRLLALIGPSGAGKSSFLRAGLLPSLPPGWRAVVISPGKRPFRALAHALAPAFAGDAGAIQELLRFDEADTAVSLVARWRRRHEQAIVIVDQFEELFTLCAEEVQAAFADLLGRLVLEADTHVAVSLRDDFLVHCAAHEALRPAFADLTVLGPLSEGALRRALVQPALACGYHFEDDALVEEMVRAVHGERGALPLLAFAASRLWESRDREAGLLTREAHRQLGGVAGALAHHAEATLQRIEASRVSVVREIFRGLVTAQGTRVSRGREELLSVFGGAKERAAGAEVLDALVSARLLTAYERPGEEEARCRQEVEVVHESLLSAWPRLVRWQTQDADGAQLRDQLRQAARFWEERGRPLDLLWTGTAYRDLALWKERYAGGLSTTEEAFASASAGLAGRRRRRRRTASAALLAVAATVAFTTSLLWREAESSRRTAEAETRRAEGSKLLAIAQLERGGSPTGALAWTIRSLELADTPEARLFALGLLQSAPAAILARPPGDGASIPDGLESQYLAFDPTGEWMAVGGYRKILLLNRDGRPPQVLGDHPGGGFRIVRVAFASGSARLVSNRAGDVRMYSVPDGRELHRRQLDDGSTGLFMRGDRFFTPTNVGRRTIVRSWPVGGSEPRTVGSAEPMSQTDIDGSGSTLAYFQGRRVRSRSLERWASPPLLLGEHETEVRAVAISPSGEYVAASDASGAIHVWLTKAGRSRPLRSFAGPGTPRLLFDPSGERLVAFGVVDNSALVRVFDLAAPPGAEPLVLRRTNPEVAPFVNGCAFDSAGRWLATANVGDSALWPVGEERPVVLRGHRGRVTDLAFTPDGGHLVSVGGDSLRLWPLTGALDAEGRVLLESPGGFPGIDIDPSGDRAVTSAGGRVLVVPLKPGPIRSLEGFSGKVQISAVAFGDGGRLVAAVPFTSPRAEKLVRVWDLESGEVRTFGPTPGAGEGFKGGVDAIAFAGREALLADGPSLSRLNLRDGTWAAVSKPDSLLGTDRQAKAALARVIGDGVSSLVRVDLGGGAVTPLSTHGSQITRAAFDATGRLVASGSMDGVVRVGPASGGEPHVLIGHTGGVRVVAFSPDGRRLASAGEDGTIRLWPVPDAGATPFHLRPHEDVLAVLRSQTNLRAVRDSKASGGYRLETGPFPGWAKRQEWWTGVVSP